MWYFGGALRADPGIILFLFLSSASTTAFIILYWLMAALANSLYDKLERCTRCSYRSMMALHSIGWPSFHPCRLGMTYTEQEC
jgi:hypothetical protein